MIDTKKLVKSFKYAFEGLQLGLKVDQNMRIHSVVGLVVLILSIILPLSKVEFLVVFLAVMFVWFAELVNTAIEEMTNLIIQEHRREAKIAKDVGAAAVLLAAIFAVAVFLLIMVPYLWRVIS